MEGMLDRYDRAASGLTSWRDRLRATAYELYGSLREDRRLAHFLAVAPMSAGTRAAAVQWRGVEKMFDLLDEGRQELEDPESLSRATAESVAGGIFGHLTRAVTKDDWPPPGEVVPQAMYVAVLPYLGPEVAEEELSIPPPD